MIADLEFSVDRVRALLENGPQSIQEAASKEDLVVPFKILQRAGANVSILTPQEYAAKETPLIIEIDPQEISIETESSDRSQDDHVEIEIKLESKGVVPTASPEWKLEIDSEGGLIEPLKETAQAVAVKPAHEKLSQPLIDVEPLDLLPATHSAEALKESIAQVRAKEVEEAPRVSAAAKRNIFAAYTPPNIAASSVADSVAIEAEQSYQEVTERILSLEIMFPHKRKNILISLDFVAYFLLSITTLILGNYIYFNYYLTADDSTGFSSMLGSLAPQRTLDFVPPAEFVSVIGKNDYQDKEISSKFVIQNEEVRSIKIVITTPAVAELTPEQIVNNTIRAPWIVRIDIDNLNITNTNAGGFHAVGNSKIYIDYLSRRRRVVVPVEISGRFDRQQDKVIAVVKISNIEDLVDVGEKTVVEPQHNGSFMINLKGDVEARTRILS